MDKTYIKGEEFKEGIGNCIDNIKNIVDLIENGSDVPILFMDEINDRFREIVQRCITIYGIQCLDALEENKEES